MTLTHDQLIALAPYSAAGFENYINAATEASSITTPTRLAMFLAQAAHESTCFTVFTENLNYRAQALRGLFPKYFPTDEVAADYAHNQQAIANRIYAGRMGNGPEASGDGWLYRGRGIFQLTGKANYINMGEALHLPLAARPDMAADPEYSCRIAVQYWEQRGLSALADAKDIEGVTRKINGGLTGLSERRALYQKACFILLGAV